MNQESKPAPEALVPPVTPETLGDTIDNLTTDGTAGHGSGAVRDAATAIAERPEGLMGTVNDLKVSLVGTAAAASERVAQTKDEVVQKVADVTPSTEDVKQVYRAARSRTGLMAAGTALLTIAGVVIRRRRAARGQRLAGVAKRVRGLF